jgi:hypothetical protein
MELEEENMVFIGEGITGRTLNSPKECTAV